MADPVNRLGESHREWFEERAGIVEFDADHARVDSELLALLMLLQRYPGALLGVTALQMTLGGETRWTLDEAQGTWRRHHVRLFLYWMRLGYTSRQISLANGNLN